MTRKTKPSKVAASCCTPSTGHTPVTADSLVLPKQGLAQPVNTVFVPGGSSLVGTSQPCILNDGENPLRKSRISPFEMAATTVTNAEFEQFVATTGYLTEAERIGWSFVFHAQVPKTVGPTRGLPEAEWWRWVDGANWRDINGPGTQADCWNRDHPVVQVSWNDAQAYAAWAGGRLPTEAEWEHAARGGLGDVRFPWGMREPNDTDYQPCNIWQGDFPRINTCADGYATTAPARSFEPNGYGLYNMVGNVWEWTCDLYTIKSLKKQVRTRLAGMKGYYLSKGGSFLCHISYCYRYRIAARSGASPDSATTHTGFRVLWPKERASRLR